jgi:hypothetical protein
MNESDNETNNHPNIQSETSSSDESVESESSSEVECPPPLRLRLQTVIDSSNACSGSQAAGNEVHGKDGTSWYSYTSRASAAGRVKNLNIMRCTPGPTSYVTSRIKERSPFSAWSTLIDENLLRHIKICTIAEAHRRLGNAEWQVGI